MAALGLAGKQPLDTQGADGALAQVPSHTRLLLVDDNSINRLVASELLMSMGAEVIAASSGREAIELLRQGQHFDAVLMDVQMPEMDGYQATQQIRALPMGARLPIIAMTAHAIAGDREKSLAAGWTTTSRSRSRRARSRPVSSAGSRVRAWPRARLRPSGSSKRRRARCSISWSGSSRSSRARRRWSDSAAAKIA